MTQDQKEKAQEVVVPVILTRIATMAAFVFEEKLMIKKLWTWLIEAIKETLNLSWTLVGLVIATLTLSWKCTANHRSRYYNYISSMVTYNRI